MLLMENPLFLAIFHSYVKLPEGMNAPTEATERFFLSTERSHQVGQPMKVELQEWTHMEADHVGPPLTKAFSWGL